MSKKRENTDNRLNDIEATIQMVEQNITALAEQVFKCGLILAALAEKLQEQDKQQNKIIQI